MKRNRLFGNKIWQATRFLTRLLDRCDQPPIFNDGPQDECDPVVHRWILGRLGHTVQVCASKDIAAGYSVCH